MINTYASENLSKAISRLQEAIKASNPKYMEYIQDSAIRRFKFVIEQYWKVLKKILSYEGVDTSVPKDVFRKAFQFQLITDEPIWIKMLHDRNHTSHEYDQKEAERVFENIKTYLPILETTYESLKQKYKIW